MATKFNIPKSPARNIINIDTFEGVDFTNSPANIEDSKSPNALNMIRDVPGKVRKRMGYELHKDYSIFLKPINILDMSFSGIKPLAVGIAQYNNDAGTISISKESDEWVTSALPNKSTVVKAGVGYVFVMDHISGDYEGTFGAVIKDASGRVLRSESSYIDGANRCYGGFAVEQNTSVSIEINLYGKGTSEWGFMVCEREVFSQSMAFHKYGEEIPESLPVYGYSLIKQDEPPLYHIGTKLLRESEYGYKEILWNDMAENISHSWAFNDNLYIVDGKKLLIYDGKEVKAVEGNGYIPTLTIAKSPKGGGTEYEALNLVQPAFIELFLGTETDTQYHLTFGDLDKTKVRAWLLNANGNWVEKKEGTHFTVNRTTGVITFTTAPGKSPLTGEDNVKIQAYRTVEGYADRINHCTIGTRFGVNGAFDRLFLSGNPEYPNADWYSQQWDATYFPDTGYSLLGSSASKIVGYSIVSNYLATHKDEYERDLSIIVRQGDLVDNEPSFRIINTLQGAGAIAPNSFNYLCTEPLFLTNNGLYAVTAQDITGEKYAQSRSFYLNGRLLTESKEALSKSLSVIYKDNYILVVGNRLYILDGLQPIRTDKTAPYATRQYAAFYCELPIAPTCMWTEGSNLYFGGEDGKSYKFYTDAKDVNSYNDDNAPIEAYWETADLEGQLFYKNKSFRYIAVKLGAALATSIKILGMRKGVWSEIKDDHSKGRYFSYANLIYSKFSYSVDKTEKIVATKLSIKKVDKARFKFQNTELNEPFSLFSYAIEYTQNNNVKG